VIIGASRAIRPVRMISAITSQQLINDAGAASKLVNTSLSSGTVFTDSFNGAGGAINRSAV